MKLWAATSELVAALGISKRAVLLQAERQQWTRRQRPSPPQGGFGGWEFEVASLPESVRVALIRHAARADAIAPVPVDVVPHEDARKAAALLWWSTVQERAGVGRFEAAQLLITMWRAGEIAAMPPDQAPKSFHTLRRWEREARAAGSVRRDARALNRKGKGVLDSDETINAFVTAQLHERPHISAIAVLKGLRARFGNDVPVTLRNLQRWLMRYRAQHRAELLHLANPDGARSRFLPAFGSASQVLELNARWEMDSTPADVMLTDGRHSIIGVVDVYSRRGLVLVSKTSKGVAIATLLRKAILAWGVPAAVKTDNGQDYTSKHFTRALTALGIRHELCRPFTPMAKPHIERFLGTLSHQLLELLPGYVGHSVAERQAIRSRQSFAKRLGESDSALFHVQLDNVGLQARCDVWCDSEYGRARHSQLGRSPFEVAAACRGTLRRVADVRALDVLLQEAPAGDGTRVVQKKGVKVDGRHYIHAALGGLVGTPVSVRLDPEDVGRIVVYDVEGKTFLCVAEAPEITGISRTEVAAAAKARARNVINAFKAEGRRVAREVKPELLADEILAHQARLAGNVTAFPAPAVAHETEALTAAADAADSIRRGGRPVPTPITPEIEEAAARERARIESMNAPPSTRTGPDGRPYDSDESTARWMLANPDKCDDADRKWLAEALQRPTFRALIGDVLPPEKQLKSA